MIVTATLWGSLVCISRSPKYRHVFLPCFWTFHSFLLILHNYRHEGNFFLFKETFVFLSILSLLFFCKEGAPFSSVHFSIRQCLCELRKRHWNTGMSGHLEGLHGKQRKGNLLRGANTWDLSCVTLSSLYPQILAPILFASLPYKIFQRYYSSIIILLRFYTQCYQTVWNSWEGNPLKLSILRGQFVGYRPHENLGKTAGRDLREERNGQPGAPSISVFPS